MSWLQGVGGVLFGQAADRNQNIADRPPLAVYLNDLHVNEYRGLEEAEGMEDVEGGEYEAKFESAFSFLVVPLETIGQRTNHNAEILASLVSYLEDRSRHLQRSVKEMK